MGEKTSNTDLRLTMELVRDQNWLAETDVELAATKSVDLLDGSDVARIIDELLTLREATAPQMAEVDALEKKWNGPLLIDDEGLVIGEIFSTLRAAILACEQQKQRADEAERELEAAKRMASSMHNKKNEAQSELAWQQFISVTPLNTMQALRVYFDDLDNYERLVTQGNHNDNDPESGLSAAARQILADIGGGK